MIYPALPALHDFGFVRLAGAGMGNCLYTYFHAFVRSYTTGERMVAPSWASLNIGPIMRGERSLRRYGTLFRAHPDEIAGLKKAAVLAVYVGRFHVVGGALEDRSTPTNGLKVVSLKHYGFDGLAPYRQQIRARLLEILRERPSTPRWGSCGHVAVHVRLGDFMVPSADDLATGRANMRLPVAWYAQVLLLLRQAQPDVPIHLFSDGRKEELAQLLTIPGVTLRREATDVADLLAMAEARLLVGSNSTFSRWACFLGDMPSIWFGPQPERRCATEATFIALGPDPSAWQTQLTGLVF